MGRFMVLKQGGSVLYVCTKFEADSLFVQKLLGGPKISKMGHLTQATPSYAAFYIPYAGRVRRTSRYHI